LKSEENKEENVHRHIELTAVFKRDFKNNIKRVRESRDLKKPLELQSNTNRDRFIYLDTIR
jgi:hypothetical protein